MSEEIDDILRQIEDNPSQEAIIITDTEVVTIPARVPKTEDDLVDLTLEKNKSIEEQADAAFQVFFDPIARGTDHSQASKEQMLEALKVKVELTKNLVELAKLKKKSIDPKVGIQINTVSPLQAGIDIEKIKEAM